jgi:simple sugar transport system ATP-binding protein
MTQTTVRSQTTARLEARGIRRSYGHVEALRGVDLAVYPGEVVALIGDNGAGKSTLTRILVGADRPTSGQILIDGEPVTFDSPTSAQKHGVGVVYQDLALADDLDLAMSGGQKQSIAVARSVAFGAQIVFMDEPTAALGVQQTAKVLDLIRRVRDQGASIVLISHNMTDVLAVADRIEVLRMGQRVATFTSAEATLENLVAAMTGGTV